MVQHIFKISRPGVIDVRCVNWNTERNAIWIEDDIQVVT